MANALIERLVQTRYEELLAKGQTETQAIEELARSIDKMAAAAAALRTIAAEVESESTTEALRRRAEKAAAAADNLKKTTFPMGGVAVPRGSQGHVDRVAAAAQAEGLRSRIPELRRNADVLKEAREEAHYALKVAQGDPSSDFRATAKRQAMFDAAAGLYRTACNELSAAEEQLQQLTQPTKGTV